MTKAAELAKMGEVITNSQIGRKNIIINGAMQVAQRGTSETGVGNTSGYFTVDRFKYEKDGTIAGRVTLTQSAVTDLNGFSNALKIDCTTADTDVAANEGIMIQYHVEGLSCQQLKSSSTSTNAFTLSFYAKSNASRAIASEIRFAEGTNLHASKLHTIGTSWARYTMTIPAASSTEVDNDNTAAFQINLFLHAGSNTSSGTIAGTTLTSLTQANRAAGIGSIVASTDNTLEITGVQLEVGSQATPFEHRSYGEERQLCYRYYYRTPDSVAGGQAANEAFPCVGNMDGSQTGAFMFIFPVPMRAAPTAIEQSGTAGDYSIRVTSDANGTSVPSASGFTSEKALVNLVSSGAGFTGGDGAFMRMEDTDAFIAFSAEL